MKRKYLLEVIHNLAIGAFVGISAYGIMILFFADEVQNPMPVWKSVLLGLSAFLCMAIIVILGGMIDKNAARKDQVQEKIKSKTDPGEDGS